MKKEDEDHHGEANEDQSDANQDAASKEKKDRSWKADAKTEARRRMGSKRRR